MPLKTKTGLEVSKALESILGENKPKMLWVDTGKKYYNKNVLNLLAKYKIPIYSTEYEEKSSVCERWNRTIKDKMYKQFTIQNNTVYIHILPKILSSYNKSEHRSIGMSPVEAKEPENYAVLYFNLYCDLERDNRKPALSIGNRVRISKHKKKTFVFIIHGIRFTHPITYKIGDLNGEPIKGTFTEKSYKRPDQNIYRIEKIIRKAKDNALVKWKGFPD